MARVQGAGGGHVTSWWIYAQLSPAAVSSSVVVFGETDHAEVNAAPHLWIRGKEKWIGDGFKLLHDFVTAERRAAEFPPPQRPPPPLRSLARFDGQEYGPEYLTFEAGVDVIPALPPVDAEGWEFGVVVATGARGWYPPQFVAWGRASACRRPRPQRLQAEPPYLGSAADSRALRRRQLEAGWR